MSDDLDRQPPLDDDAPPPDAADDEVLEGEETLYETTDAVVPDEVVPATPSAQPSYFTRNRILILIAAALAVLVLIMLVRALANRGQQTTATPGVTPQATLQATFTPSPAVGQTTTPSPSPAPPTATPAPTPALQVGSRVRVISTDGFGVRFRSGPGSTYVTYAILGEGSELTILGGPEEAEDFVWWRLRADDGTVGWVVEDFLEPMGG